MNTLVFLAAEGGLGDLGFGKSDVGIGNAALYALIGLLIVIAVLALLVGVFYLSGFLFRSKLFNKRSEKKSQAVETAPEPDDDDEELLAVITAAISAVYDGETEGDAKPEFVIRRVKRKK